jgi:hemerythrin
MLPANLTTGIHEIDDAHARLIWEVQLFASAFTNGLFPTNADTQAFIEMLRDHFTSHFEAEERLMDQCGFPEWVTHREEHMQFFDVFLIHRARIQRGASPDEVAKLRDDILAWMRHHVLEEDAKLALWITSATG